MIFILSTRISDCDSITLSLRIVPYLQHSQIIFLLSIHHSVRAAEKYLFISNLKGVGEKKVSRLLGKLLSRLD